MHELSLVEGLCTQLATLAQEHRARRIVHVTLDVGAMSNVVPELLRQAFLAMRGVEPLIERSELTIREIPLVIACDACHRETEIEEFRFVCPHCDAARIRILQGEELLLRDVELEIEESHEDDGDPTRTREGESAQVE